MSDVTRELSGCTAREFRSLLKSGISFAAFLIAASCCFAQGPPPPKHAGPATTASGPSAEQALQQARRGQCQGVVPTLKKLATNPATGVDTRKEAATLGLRCSMTIDDRATALDFLTILGKQFPKDPDVLFITVHAYSDLSSRTAQDLGRYAPQSIPARKLNAEALEMQGKWTEAQNEYKAILERDPNQKGIHYLMGRLLLSKPNGDAAAVQEAKAEFEKELQVDPNNAGAEYILGEIARQGSDWDTAIARFSKAAALDPNFGDAYMGWGFCLVTVKRYEEAVPPLRMAVRLEGENPSAHYNLAVALSRSGKKEEAEKEFAIHRKMTEKPAPAATNPN